MSQNIFTEANIYIINGLLVDKEEMDDHYTCSMYTPLLCNEMYLQFYCILIET